MEGGGCERQVVACGRERMDPDTCAMACLLTSDSSLKRWSEAFAAHRPGSLTGSLQGSLPSSDVRDAFHMSSFTWVLGYRLCLPLCASFIESFPQLLFTPF